MGALWARLVPTVIALAFYFCFADTVLIGQCLYYRKVRATNAALKDSPLNDQDTDPLLRQTNSDLGLPGSYRRPSTSHSRQNSRAGCDRLLPIVENDDAGSSWRRDSISVLLVCVVGIMGWAISWKAGFWVPTPESQSVTVEEKALGAELLGYLSAACYLG